MRSLPPPSLRIPSSRTSEFRRQPPAGTLEAFYSLSTQHTAPPSPSCPPPTCPPAGERLDPGHHGQPSTSTHKEAELPRHTAISGSPRLSAPIASLVVSQIDDALRREKRNCSVFGGGDGRLRRCSTKAMPVTMRRSIERDVVVFQQTTTGPAESAPRAASPGDQRWQAVR